MKKLGSRVTEVYQITIPKEIRKTCGFEIGMFVIFKKDKKGIYIVPAKLVEVERK